MDDAKLSFAKFDSAKFPSLVESLQHSITNPLLLQNLSDWLITSFDGEAVKVQEPDANIKRMIRFFEPTMEMTEIPEEEYYLPERTAMRLYDNADLWYIILLANNIFRRLDYNKPMMKTIPAVQLQRIATFTKMENNRVRTFKENDILYMFKR